jgi:2-phosphosulfolactate phosphatase
LLIDVALVPAEAYRWRNRVCIVVDELRASSSIVTALDCGCRNVIPVAGLHNARRLARKHEYLLAGERNGLKPPDFDFNNSPSELAQADLGGKTLVLSTSNGTKVLLGLSHAPAVLVGCLLNATACCQQGLALAEQYGAGLGIVCAGTNGQFVLDDAVAVGFLVDRVAGLLDAYGGECTLNDAALTAHRLSRGYADFDTAFRQSASGRRVIEIGAEEDLAFCARVDTSRVVPRLVLSTPPLIERLI